MTSDINNNYGLKDVDYTYRGVDHTNLGDRKFYAAGNNIDATVPITSVDVDGMVHVTDNPNIANGLTSSETGSGRVLELDLSNTKLMDLDSKLESASDLGIALNKITNAEIGSVRGAFEHVEASSGSNKFKAEAKASIIDAVKKDGYDGFSYRGGNPLKEAGVDVDFNGAVLFDSNKIEKVGESQYSRSPESIAREQAIMQKEMERVASDNSNVFHNDEAGREFLGTESTPLADYDVSMRTKELIMRRDEGLERLQNMEQKGTLDSNIKTEMEAAQTIKQDTELEAEVMKAGIFCMGD